MPTLYLCDADFQCGCSSCPPCIPADCDVTSATAALYMNVGVTSSDITMEDNPAYQSIVMESAGPNYI